MPGLLDPNDDGLISPEERKQIAMQNLFSGLLQGGLQMVAAGENLQPWQRAQMLGQVGQTIGGIPGGIQQGLSAAAQQKLRGIQGAEAKKKLQDQKEWDATLADPEKVQGFIGSLPKPYQSIALAQLKAQGPAALTQIMQHSNDLEMKNLQMEKLRQEAAQREAYMNFIRNGGAPQGNAPQAAAPLPAFQYPGQAQAGPTPVSGGESPPPQSVLRLTPAQQALAAPQSAPAQPYQPQTTTSLLGSLGPEQRAMLYGMDPKTGLGKLWELANQGTQVAWDNEANRAVFLPKNMQPDPRRFSPLDDQKFQLELQKYQQAVRQDAVGPNGQPNQAAIDAKAAATKAEAEARAQVDQQYGGQSELAKSALKDYGDIRNAAQSAVSEKGLLYEMEDLLNRGVAAGPLVDSRMMGRRVLEEFGLGNMPDPMVNRTVFNNIAAQRVLKILQSRALGSGTAISGGDLKFAENLAAKNGNFDDKELKALVAIGQKYADKTIETHDKEVARLRTLPQFKDAPEEYFRIQAPTREQWQQQNGVTPQSRPKNKAEYDALPSGTVYIAPNGERKVKP